jgi:putative addiction module component (TIGR02574 family)
MSEVGAAVLQSALALPEKERVWLVQQLLKSLPPQRADEVEDAFLEELERRAEESERDPSSLVPGSDIKRLS